MPSGKVLIIDDLPETKKFFTELLNGTQISHLNFVSLTDLGPQFKKEPLTLANLTQSLPNFSSEFDFLFVNAHFGKGERWKFNGVDFVWSMRGISENYDPLGQQNAIFLQMPIILYSVLPIQYLVAFSVEKFGQNIFRIPYKNSLCNYLKITQNREQIKTDVVNSIQDFVKPSHQSIGKDVYYSRLKLVTDDFIKNFRHDVRNPLQENNPDGLERARVRLARIANAMQKKIDGIDLSDCDLFDKVLLIQKKLEKFTAKKPRVPADFKNEITRLQESVIRIADLHSLYKVNVSDFLNPRLEAKTGILIIEDEYSTAKQYRSELIKDLGFDKKNICLITGKKDHQPDAVIKKIKKLQKASKRIELAIIDIMLGENERAGIEILRKIKFEYPQIRLVVISGRNDLQFEALSHGADYYATKPISKTNLKTIIEKAIFWKKVLYIESAASHQENVSLVRSFKPNSQEIDDTEQVYDDLLQNIKRFLESKYIAFDHKIIKNRINEELHEYIEDGHYDLVLLDCFSDDETPQTLGKQLFKQIRKLNRNIPIIMIALTGHGGFKNRIIFQELKHHFQIDHDDFWVKPLNFQRLRRINEIFRQQGAIKNDVRYTLLLPKKHQCHEKLVLVLPPQPRAKPENQDTLFLDYLRRVFAENGIEELPKDVVITQDKRWLIAGSRKKRAVYSIVREGQNLSICQGASLEPEKRRENDSIKDRYLNRINRDFGGATIWEGEGYWWNEGKSCKDDHYIIHVLTRYAPGNRKKLFELISDYGKETIQEAIFLQEERVNTYEKLKADSR